MPTYQHRPLPLSHPPERRQPGLPSLPSFLPPTFTRAAGGHQAQVHKLPWVAISWVQPFEPYITLLRNFPGPVIWDRPGTSVKNQIPRPHPTYRYRYSLSRVRLFATPWTVAYQVPPSMGFSLVGGIPSPENGWNQRRSLSGELGVPGSWGQEGRAGPQFPQATRG